MKLPISINLAAMSWAQHEAKRLVRFKKGRTGQPPSWEGHGEDITTHTAGQPLTDRAYWEGRYVLCELRIENEAGEGVTLADAVVSVSRERRIVSTALVGRDVTVKEYINEGDWAISIVVGLQGVQDGVMADVWPDAQVRELRKLLETKEALRVQSSFLDVWGISRMVVKSISATQQTDSNYQTMSISAVSDEDYEIFSNDYEAPKGAE